MTVELVRVCMFCLLCATHAHCSSHHDIDNTHTSGELKTTYNDGGGGTDIPEVAHLETHRTKRNNESQSELTSRDFYITELLKRFGDGETLSRAGLTELLDLHNFHITDGKVDQTKSNNSRNIDCLSVNKIFGDSEQLNQDEFKDLCPKLLYHKTFGVSCTEKDRNTEADPHDEDVQSSTIVVWVYASASVVLISLCGLLAVAVIPLMQKSIYHSLLQFLVALAVGTLCGDALLHLLPHAMLTSHGAHDHGPHEHGGDESQHDIYLWRGFVASLAVLFFYFTEKCLSIVTDWRKKTQRKHKLNTRVRVMRDDNRVLEEGRVGEKLCKHKYSSYPYCYGEIANSAGENNQKTGDCEINSISQIRDENGTTKHEDTDLHKEEMPNSEKQLLDGSGDRLPEYTVILREHETRHHGHAHTHGHVHSAPGSMSSVAWMVVMGDGLHNLADGLAIGTAFAANVGGGFSTAVAVFCHELPHEIGDFAVLLKAGMSAKQAVFYNLLSSILCFLGMSLGIVLGHNESVKPWVFSFAAGMFLYIALVDMVPELSSSHSKEGRSLCQCLLQLCGLMTGIGVMLIIALYEHTIMESFQHSF